MGYRVQTPRPNVEYLLKAFELAYLYDSVYRFSRETIIRPELNRLEDSRFVELPGRLNRWVGEVDLVWLILADTLAPEDPLEEFIDRLHEEGDEFIAKAKAREIFLPIRSDVVNDPVEIREKIESRLSRNAYVSPKLVHDYSNNHDHFQLPRRRQVSTNAATPSHRRFPQDRTTGSSCLFASIGLVASSALSPEALSRIIDNS